MHKGSRYYKLSLLAFTLVSMLTLSSCEKTTNKLEARDWRRSYQNNDIIPYGTYITYSLLDSIFPNSDIISSRAPLEVQLHALDYYENRTYDTDQQGDTVGIEEENLNDEYLRDLYLDVDSDDTAYIFVDSEFDPRKDEIVLLNKFVGRGNIVFVSAEEFNDDFLESLSLQMERSYLMDTIRLDYNTVSDTILEAREDSLVIVKREVYTQFERPDTTYILKDYLDKEYMFSNLETNARHRLSIDSCSLPLEILGENIRGEISFLRVKYGYGYFYIHLVPSSFTNFYMLNLNKYDYAMRSLSYIEDGYTIYWDEYYKQGPLEDRSMFSVIFKSKALTLAFIICMVGIFLFMLFRAKRKQRAIPIILAPSNTSVEFVETISNIYHKKKDYKGSVEKRHAYFLNYIRRNYYLATEQIDAEFKKVLTAKSGVSIFIINDIFAFYQEVSQVSENDRDMFMNYNRKLEAFYKIARNK